ncbi:addiction module toxin RelE [Actinosynnema sp. ALI-1.44]|uniref:type II toxin-antitoxin system RelE/ParE family toxin n=1 Tax=Actinosynnema sp. ALI-1.44 TaxID=1933779 RepID=UPI00097C7FAE|nr:type II toxin-antitoxin system RelE/ParE family toxin [Actinosynnema sp. ALI-1.44]ONI85806.1 addiction module toxin RelE [Actinosynnema sp. ALI-1.44]
MDWGTVELEPEICEWLRGLGEAAVNHVAFYIDLLAERGPLLGEPYTRQLEGKLRELRFWLDERQTRISYWIAPGRRIILLTTWHKTKMRETAEVERAHRAMRQCQEEQRTVDEEEL